MKPLTHCLAATDLSASGNLAMARAMQLTQALGIPLDVLHVLPQTLVQQVQRWLIGHDPALLERLDQQCHEELSALAERFAEQETPAPGILVRQGEPSEVISREVDARGSDLLVVGAHGSGHLHEAMIGSTPISLLGQVNCPLLIVRQMARTPYRRALIAVDFSPRSAKLLQLAEQIAPQAERILLHALDLPFSGRLQMAGVAKSELQGLQDKAEEQAKEQFHALTAGLEGQAQRCVIRHGDPSLCILDYTKQHDCDLILLAQQPRHKLSELLLGSTTRHVVYQSQQDVLILRQ